MTHDRDTPGRPPDDPERMLVKLEDVLHGLPYDRALPDLDALLALAGVDRTLLTSDDRARKLLHEAILARPLSSLDDVAVLRTEVELLTVEVRVLTDRMRDSETSREEAARAATRLTEIRMKLDELRRQL